MRSRVSLANKCLAIFGCAIVIIIASTLSVPWMRSDDLVQDLVQDYQLEIARQLADIWINPDLTGGFTHEDMSIRLVQIESGGDTFDGRAGSFFINQEDHGRE